MCNPRTPVRWKAEIGEWYGLASLERTACDRNKKRTCLKQDEKTEPSHAKLIPDLPVRVLHHEVFQRKKAGKWP